MTPDRSLRVVYYCLAPFLDHVASHVRALARVCDLHVVFEVSPGAWAGNILGLSTGGFEPGIQRVDSLVKSSLPIRAAEFFSGASLWYLTFPRLQSPGNLASAAAMRGLLRTIRPNVIHIDGDSPRAVLWQMGTRVPVVVSVHEPRMPGTGWHLLRRLAKRTLIRRADHLLVFSDTARYLLTRRIRRPAAAISVSPLCTKEVFREFGDVSLTEDVPPLILSVGWLTHRKGFDVLVAAAHTVARKHPELRFVIGGRPGEDYEALLPLVQRGPAQIELIERFLTPAELADLMRRAALVVLPYREATQSGALLTAFAFDTPVIASAVGGMREQIAHGATGVLVPPGDAGQLATAIAGAVEDHTARERMRGRISHLRESELSADRFADTCRGIYLNLNHRSKSTPQQGLR